MHIKTLLNYTTKFKSFVFQDPRLCRDSKRILIPVVPRKNSKPVCSRCGCSCTVYDHLKQREFLLPPIRNIAVVLLYTMRRVNCLHCGKVVVEQLSWATGNSPVTKQFAAFLAFWARKLPWTDTAKSFRVSWDSWIFLEKKNRLWGKPRARLRDLLNMNLHTVKAYLFKEYFDHLWMIST